MYKKRKKEDTQYMKGVKNLEARQGLPLSLWRMLFMHDKKKKIYIIEENYKKKLRKKTKRGRKPKIEFSELIDRVRKKREKKEEIKEKNETEKEKKERMMRNYCKSYYKNMKNIKKKMIESKKKYVDQLNEIVKKYGDDMKEFLNEFIVRLKLENKMYDKINENKDFASFSKEVKSILTKTNEKYLNKIKDYIYEHNEKYNELKTYIYLLSSKFDTKIKFPQYIPNEIFIKKMGNEDVKKEMKKNISYITIKPFELSKENNKL